MWIHTGLCVGRVVCIFSHIYNFFICFEDMYKDKDWKSLYP